MTASNTTRLSTAADRSHSMTARTQAFSYQPSRAALATRSWNAVQCTAAGPERRAAIARHFEEFAPTLGARRV
jgi:hypothetical protein